MSDGGKGSKARPYSISLNEFDKNWESIFGRKNEEHKTTKANTSDQSSEPGGVVVPGLQQDSNG